MLLNAYHLSAWSRLLEQADIFFLPCPFKWLFGLDCPGCGFQRSLLALLKGHWQESFNLYPATVPLLLTFIIILPSSYFTKVNLSLPIKIMYTITGGIILISYLYKLYQGHTH